MCSGKIHLFLSGLHTNTLSYRFSCGTPVMAYTEVQKWLELSGLKCHEVARVLQNHSLSCSLLRLRRHRTQTWLEHPYPSHVSPLSSASCRLELELAGRSCTPLSPSAERNSHISCFCGALSKHTLPLFLPT